MSVSFGEWSINSCTWSTSRVWSRGRRHGFGSEPTLNYTRNGFRFKGETLNLAGDIAVNVVWSRELPSVPSSVRIYRDSLGHWYASFVVQADAPKFLARSTMAKKSADAAIGVAKQALIDMSHKHGRTVLLVHPAHTTMDCAQCGARAKHALPLGERTYTCTACGAVSPRDKNSARVMLNRAGLNPDGADRGRPVQSPTEQAA